MILLWVLTALWYWFMVKGVQDSDVFAPGKLLRRIWGGLLIAGAVALIFMIYDANVGGNGARYGSLAEYLVFSDSWEQTVVTSGRHPSVCIRNSSRFTSCSASVGYLWYHDDRQDHGRDDRCDGSDL